MGSAVALKLSEQVDAVLEACFRSGDAIAGRIGRASRAVEFSVKHLPGVWPVQVAANFKFATPDELHISPGSRVAWAIVPDGVEPKLERVPEPSFVVRQDGGRFLGWPLEEPCDLERLERVNESLAIAVGGVVGEVVEIVSNPGGVNVRTRARRACDPSRFSLGVPGTLRGPYGLVTPESCGRVVLEALDASRVYSLTALEGATKGKNY